MTQTLGPNVEIRRIHSNTRCELALSHDSSYCGTMSWETQHEQVPLYADWLAATAVIACASFVLLTATLLPLPGLIAVVGCLVSVLVGLFVSAHARLAVRVVLPRDLETPLLLASDGVFYGQYQRLAALLVKTSRQTDPIYRALAADQVDTLIASLTTIAAGTLVFEGTETWRLAYEQLLRSPGLYLYRSVAWIKAAGYWQDEPGRKSMQVNFELHESEQLSIERIAIIADEFWPLAETWPVEPVRCWLQEQNARGLWLKIVRESSLGTEPDLLADVGIYGTRALGRQEVGEDGRTLRFTLTFDYAKLLEAESRWNRLAVYAESYSVHLDRTRPED